LADRLGFDYVWEVEHHFLEEYSHSSAPEVFLGACSQRSRQIRLGHGIVLHPPAYNHPARIAERIATLDLVSNGRVDWGTGESASRVELEAFGVDPAAKKEMWAESVRETAKMMAQSPYPGYQGKYFSMPPRNVVPKPVQRPHPPLWVACSNRHTIRAAARLGMGALTLAFMDPGEAKTWVDEYHRAFATECTPIGRAVNPSVAMVAGFSCHRDESVAVERGMDGLRFFHYALSHYYFDGSHVPGRTDLWDMWQKAPHAPPKSRGGIGTPEQIAAHLRRLEDAGVDQVVFLQQAGGIAHEHICQSLELFAAEVMPEFKARHAERTAAKNEKLAAAVERAESRIAPLEECADPPIIDAYPKAASAPRDEAEVDKARDSWATAIEGGRRS
ncbi:LLM class flavin-dependent oxidoreductase, partial [Candidatus Poribacteria bacterium]|nr:LLM class flavin-dependent oxidoreductase [Candidatus Poribacteria bacterium]